MREARQTAKSGAREWVEGRGGCRGCDENVPRGVTLGAERDGPARRSGPPGRPEKAILTKENLVPRL